MHKNFLFDNDDSLVVIITHFVERNRKETQRARIRRLPDADDQHVSVHRNRARSRLPRRRRNRLRPSDGLHRQYDL